MVKGSVIQSVLFPRRKWTLEAAREWLKAHKFLHLGVDIKENFLRFRQVEPKKRKRYRTMTLLKDENGNALIEAILMF